MPPSAVLAWILLLPG